MNRRHVLASGIGVVVGISGCIDRFGGAATDDSDDERESGDEDHEPPDPKEFPDRPSELDPDSVEAYVDEYEQVYQHNSHITPATRGVNSTCSTVVDHEDDHGIYVSAACFVNHPTEESEGGGPSFPALFLVTPDETVRIEPSTVDHDDPYLSDDQVPLDAYGVWLSNFSDRQCDLSVELTHLDGERATVLDETVTLDTESGVYVSSVAGIAGDYELHAELPSGDTTTKTLAVPDDTGRFPSRPDPLYAVHVTPDEAVVSRGIHFEDP